MQIQEQTFIQLLDNPFYIISTYILNIFLLALEIKLFHDN